MKENVNKNENHNTHIPYDTQQQVYEPRNEVVKISEIVKRTAANDFLVCWKIHHVWPSKYAKEFEMLKKLTI